MWLALAVLALAAAAVDGQTMTTFNGHTYILYRETRDYRGAKTAATQKTYLGKSGYLATIMTAAEMSVVTNPTFKNNVAAWISGTDAFRAYVLSFSLAFAKACINFVSFRLVWIAQSKFVCHGFGPFSWAGDPRSVDS